MNAPQWFDSVMVAEDLEAFAQLPKEEDELHEYKASLTADDDLKRKLSVAGSAFWNVGGGVFICGVNGRGEFDGGRALNVGRQSLRDWADQALAKVSPSGPYAIRCIEGRAQPGRGVLLVAFGESHLAPHMAPDHKYYIRAGAHSVPATAFIIEALIARRQLSRPLLRHVVRANPNYANVLQFGVVTASNHHALDVKLELPALKLIGNEPKTFQFGVIGPENPFFIDFDLLTLEPEKLQPFGVKIYYHDAGGRRYDETFIVDVDSQMGHAMGDRMGEQLVRAVNQVAQHLGGILHSLPSNNQRRR